jgi:hypothetical protein
MPAELAADYGRDIEVGIAALPEIGNVRNAGGPLDYLAA